MTPTERSFWVSARVSSPAMPTTPCVLQKAVQRLLRAPVARRVGEFLDDEAGDLHPARLEIVGRDAVVADERVRQRDQLPGVGGIGQDLLIAGHAGIEDDFADRRSRRAPKAVPV